jgi:histone H3/H4
MFKAKRMIDTENQEHILSLAPFTKLIRKEGVRASEKGAEALREVVENIASEIVKVAITLAEHASRKTITEKDVKLAFEQWRKRF